MKKKILSLLFVFAFLFARADEGMWLLYMLGDQTYNDMVKRGLKLSKEQLYSLNKASLKDAIIIFGGGCTGEIVSKEGLIFTNHHCGYSAIADASTVEKNYLKDGFWAKSKEEEIPAAGLSVQFLVRIEDVTNDVEQALADLNGSDRANKLQAVSANLAYRATQGSKLEARVLSFFKNNQYLLFVYERYRDVRLVGTPPESIGAFGGNTDNWEWPRHTGDFSVFRVYMGNDGKPAEYAADNVPFKPKHFLSVSTKGVKDGDFTMVLGYPGGTNRYETSLGVKLKIEIENTAIVHLRDERLKLMLNEMNKSDAVRLQLGSNYAGTANYWKFFDGERKQLLRYDVYGKKKLEEQKFETWAMGKPEYNGLFAKYEQTYKEWWPYTKHRIYINEGILGSPLAAYAASLQALERTLNKNNPSAEEIKKMTESLSNAREIFLSNENKPSDQNILAVMCRVFYSDIDPAQHPADFYSKLRTQYGDLSNEATYKKYAADVFSKTMIFDDVRWSAFIAVPDATTLQADPAYEYATSFIRNYANYQTKFSEFTNQNNDLGRIYLKGILEMNKGKVMYPDANFTMRLSMGNVKSYRLNNNSSYDYACTMNGMLAKYKPGDYEFDLPSNLLEAASKRDFGIYKDERTNDLPITFITTNDITGGNSGSPVLNANGELVGLVFDGNYEALSHKISFDKDLNRTICVDIRFVLWCIDKLGGAHNLVQELMAEQATQVMLEDKLSLKRLALVIGVKSYQYVSPLQNSLNDARDMSASLKAKGFEVIEVYDPKTKREMQDAIRKYFGLLQNQKNTAGLVFYSGHGMQVDGSNYLIPAQANPQIKADIDDQCLNMDYVMGAIEQAGNPLNIFILDACRNNPFRSFYRSNEQGLSMVNTPKGSYIVYSTKPGSVASDGIGRNGLFTSKLLKYLDSDGLNIEQVFKRVAADVSIESNDAQRPWIASDYTGDFYFTKD